MLDMFKRPDDAPEFNEYYMLPGAAAIVGSGALFATGTHQHTLSILCINTSYLYTLPIHPIYYTPYHSTTYSPTQRILSTY